MNCGSRSIKRSDAVFMGIALLLAVMFMPFFRDSVIYAGGLLRGKVLNHDKWNSFLLVNTFSLFSVFCIVALCHYLVRFKLVRSLSGLFSLASLLSFFFFLIGVCAFRNADWSVYFFHDRFDTGMDYFHSVFGQASFYPGLAKLTYKLNCFFVSASLSDLGLSHRLLRSEQSLLFPFIILNLFSCVSIVFISSFVFGESRKGLLSCICVLLSYSVFYAVERGNIVLQAFVFLLFFIIFYKSENSILRELSLVSLAIAFGLKLYPAFFGILLVLEKRWREAFRCIVYALLVFVLSEVIYYFLNGGSAFVLSSLLDWIKFLCYAIFRKNILVLIFSCVFAAVCIGILIFALVKSRRNWVKLFLIGFLSIIGGIQFNYSYAWLMLIPSFVYFLAEEKDISRKNITYFVFFGLINFLYPLFGNYGSLFLSLSGLIRVIVTIVFAMVIIIDEVFIYYKDKKIIAG